jgi:hypothetical protein
LLDEDRLEIANAVACLASDHASYANDADVDIVKDSAHTGA